MACKTMLLGATGAPAPLGSRRSGRAYWQRNRKAKRATIAGLTGEKVTIAQALRSARQESLLKDVQPCTKSSFEKLKKQREAGRNSINDSMHRTSFGT